ncbi:divalent-cation tolerance protein CutA [Croceicoccus bisphenolivorans]|uniref:divalent-cation tolerance protein CutA n=1 Tax=Croceicoccus bisphenolivorans TaxID=1783232 RepID=UPI00082F5FAD|nr:divalent cation tolerance protein CutA [Croceicoccus bisphenolivorans]
MSGAALIWAPFADEASAGQVADMLLDEGLVACCNLIPVKSRYVWKGERGEGEECGALFKTRADMLQRAVARLEELHPYDTPAITGWTCEAAGGETLAWLAVIGATGPHAT